MQNIDENSDEEADEDVYNQAENEQYAKNEETFSRSSSEQEEKKSEASPIMTRLGRNKSQQRPTSKDLESEKRISKDLRVN